MKAFIITIVGIIVALVASLINVTWLMVLSGFIALVGAYAQYSDAKPFELAFLPTTWQQVGTEFNLVIPKTVHGKQNPAVTVYMGTVPEFEQVIADIKTKSNHEVIVATSFPFEGKLIIK